MKPALAFHSEQIAGQSPQAAWQRPLLQAVFPSCSVQLCRLLGTVNHPRQGRTAVGLRSGPHGTLRAGQFLLQMLGGILEDLTVTKRTSFPPIVSTLALAAKILERSPAL